MEINFETFVPKFNEIIARGLSSGLGNRNGQMCIEAAVCAALDLPHGANPPCVADSVRNFKIVLNDSNWSSPEARAKGLYKLGIAQVGSKGVVDDIEFLTKLSQKLIRVFIPKLFREVFPTNETLLVAAKRCEDEGTADAARYAADAADAADAARYAARYAAWCAARYAAWCAARYAAWCAADAAWCAAGAARYAADAADAAGAASAARKRDEYLTLAADLALEVLTELKSPGIEYI